MACMLVLASTEVFHSMSGSSCVCGDKFKHSGYLKRHQKTCGDYARSLTTTHDLAVQYSQQQANKHRVDGTNPYQSDALEKSSATTSSASTDMQMLPEDQGRKRQRRNEAGSGDDVRAKPGFRLK